jgi:hypothetical protein
MPMIKNKKNTDKALFSLSLRRLSEREQVQGKEQGRDLDI